MLGSQCSTATNGDQSGVTLLGEDRHESNLPDAARRHVQSCFVDRPPSQLPNGPRHKS